MKYKYLFFDLDRTLWDFNANSSKALTTIYQEYRLENYFENTDEFLQIYNQHNDELWEMYRSGLIKKQDLRIKRFALTLAEKNLNNNALSYEIGERYMTITPRLNILAPNTMDTLEYLSKKYNNLYILTNGFLGTQVSKIKYSAIDKYFKRIFSSEEFGINKPRKEIFHWAVSSVHAHRDECLMIGDDLEVDVKGAMNYGIDAVWYNPLQIESDFNPTHTIQDLIELKTVL